MKKLFTLIGLCMLLSCGPSSNKFPKTFQDNFDEKCRKLVLSERQLGQEYFFSIKGLEINEASIKYIGNVVTAKHDTLKVINFVGYSGKQEGARRATGRVFIYDAEDRLAGFYSVGGAKDIPSKVEDGALIFSSEGCNQPASISLKDSIPRMIFVRCTEKDGDIYYLETDPTYKQ